MIDLLHGVFSGSGQDTQEAQRSIRGPAVFLNSSLPNFTSVIADLATSSTIDPSPPPSLSLGIGLDTMARIGLPGRLDHPTDIYHTRQQL
ncbi:hypothetical protein PGTUg99_004127 [Puccinia graminis f. sp. tritici]|uniref:Uncharacterized protein n=1 Tax=Puccinia graminis f. sp. tritici TaxID=56615 RepID=A0A5B0RVA3_PUCGR|nr:hypothetical protein PGTUg99_004127 [Puccinia graminis f. sp. tritici]